MGTKAKSQAAKAEEFIIDTASIEPFGFLNGVDDLPSDSDIWGDRYPKAQWSNPKKCWEFPAKHFAGTKIEQNYEMVDVDHGANVESGALIDLIHFTIIARSSVWETEGSDGKMVYAAQPPDGADGWSKRYYFLGLIRELESDELVIVTLKGRTGQHFEGAYEAARRRIVRLVRQTSGRTVPGYVFWMPLQAGGKIMAGSKVQSPIWPPVVAIDDISELDDVGISNLLNSLYIGDKLVKSIRDYLFTEAKQWTSEVALLPAPSTALQLSAPAISILPGGVLYFTDLSDKTPNEWIKAAMTITGLFDHESHASNAYAKMLRSKGLTNDSRANQWEAWRVEVEQRYQEMIDRQSSVEIERMLQAGG